MYTALIELLNKSIITVKFVIIANMDKVSKIKQQAN